MSHADDDREPAGAVSDQNRESQEPGMHGQEADREHTQDKRQGGAQDRAEESEHGGRVGGASEGSQATGDPRGAG